MRVTSGNDTVLYDSAKGDGDAIDGASDIIARPLRLEHLYLYSVQMVFSDPSGLDGYAWLEGTNAAKDLATGFPPDDAPWAIIREPKDTAKELNNISDVDPITGEPGNNVTWNVTNAGYRYVRARAKVDAGDTDVKVLVYGKGT